MTFLIGARLAMGRKPWVPQKLLARRLPPRFLPRLLNAASRVVRWLEYLLKPRLVFLQEWLVFRRVAGALIMICGLLLILPLPASAIAACLHGSAARPRHSRTRRRIFLTGYFVFLVCAAYFVFLALGGAHVWDNLRQHLPVVSPESTRHLVAYKR